MAGDVGFVHQLSDDPPGFADEQPDVAEIHEFKTSLVRIVDSIPAVGVQYRLRLGWGMGRW